MAYNKKDIDFVDIAIMTELKKYPPATQREIGDTIGRAHATIAQRVRWLRRHGYVQSSPLVRKGAARATVLTHKGFEALEDQGLK